MYNSRRLNEDITSIETIRSLTDIYQQISAISILQVKNSVSRTRAFLAGVSLVYSHVKQSYVKNTQSLISRKKDITSLDFVRRNNKEVLVFVSANQSLYGDLISRVFEDFIKEVYDAVHCIGEYPAAFEWFYMQESDLYRLALLSHDAQIDEAMVEKEIKNVLQNPVLAQEFLNNITYFLSILSADEISDVMEDVFLVMSDSKTNGEQFFKGRKRRKTKDPAFIFSTIAQSCLLISSFLPEEKKGVVNLFALVFNMVAQATQRDDVAGEDDEEIIGSMTKQDLSMNMALLTKVLSQISQNSRSDYIIETAKNIRVDDGCDNSQDLTEIIQELQFYLHTIVEDVTNQIRTRLALVYDNN